MKLAICGITTNSPPLSLTQTRIVPFDLSSRTSLNPNHSLNVKFVFRCRLYRLSVFRILDDKIRNLTSTSGTGGGSRKKVRGNGKGGSVERVFVEVVRGSFSLPCCARNRSRSRCKPPTTLRYVNEVTFCAIENDGPRLSKLNALECLQ